MEMFWIGYMLACTLVDMVCIRLLMDGYFTKVAEDEARLAQEETTTTTSRPRRKDKSKRRATTPLQTVVIQQHAPG
jgi:hypothetical protein